MSPKRNHFSRDLKRRVIYQACTLNKGTTQIAIDLDMPLRVVQHIIQMWRELGDVCRDRKGRGRAPLLAPEATKVMSAFSEPSSGVSADSVAAVRGCLDRTLPRYILG